MPSPLRYLPLVVAPLLLMPLACGGSADAPTESEAPELTSVSFDESSIHLDLQSNETVRVMPVNGGSKGYIAARAGTSKTISLGTEDMWRKLHPGVAIPEAGATAKSEAERAKAEARLRQLSGTLDATFLRDGVQISKAQVRTETAQAFPKFFGSNPVQMQTGLLNIPKDADEIAFSIDLADAGDPNAHASMREDELAIVLVVGGHADRRNALFINTVEHGRVEQILEGTTLAKGGRFTLAFDEDRAEAIVDYSRIDRFLGTEVGQKGFRQNLLGEVDFDVVGAYRFNDGSDWHEFRLAKNTTGLMAGTWYTLDVDAPPSATEVEVFFEVRATLIADYTGHGTIENRRFSQGARVPVGDKFDNPGGVSGKNYRFALR